MYTQGMLPLNGVFCSLDFFFPKTYLLNFKDTS